MLKRILGIAMLAAAVAAPAAAQAPTQPPKEKPATEKPAATAPAPPPMAGRNPQPVNIKLEFTITDQVGSAEPAKKTVSMVVADWKNGSIRSSGSVVVGRERFNVELNVDATPTIVKDNTIRLDVILQYIPKPGSENASSGEGRAQLNERLGLIVESGKKMVLSQATDPTTDRKMTVELLATIQK